MCMPDAGNFKAYFNRGILSTQSVSHAFEKNADGTPKFDSLIDKLKTPNDPLRAKIAGQFLEVLPSFIKPANTEGGSDFNTTLFHHGLKTPDTVVAASNINDQFAFWEKELLKTPGGHAVIHDKIVVIDPFSPNCVVITGSHNLGYRGSYNNDENMVIVKGNQALAAAYAVHILDVYDHYRWRYILQTQSKNAFTGLLPNDTWQDKYFNPKYPSAMDAFLWAS